MVYISIMSARKHTTSYVCVVSIPHVLFHKTQIANHGVEKDLIYY